MRCLQDNVFLARPSELRFVLFCVWATLGIMVIVQLCANAFWAECEPGVPCKWKKSQNEVFADVMYTRVPRVKKYSQDGADFSYIGAAKTPGLYEPGERDCVRPFVEGFKARVGSLRSDPALVHELYQYLHLENSTYGRSVVADIWNASVDYEPMLDRVATCARENRPLHETLCAWLADPGMAPTLLEPPSADSNAAGLRFAMHQILVFERFALEAGRSREFRIFMAAHFASLNSVVEKGIVDISRAQGESDDLISFKIEKWNSIFMPTQELKFLDSNGGTPSKSIEGKTV